VKEKNCFEGGLVLDFERVVERVARRVIERAFDRTVERELGL